MTTENMSFFMSGMVAGAMCIGEVAMILFVAAGFWRWGVAVICAVIGTLNIFGVAMLVSYGADILSATFLMIKINLISSVVLLPIAAAIAWVAGKFSTHVGGLHAK